MSEYWNRRWAEMAEALKTHPLSEFRSPSSGALSKYIVKQNFGQGGPEAVVDWTMQYLDAGYCQDSLVGNPGAVYHRDCSTPSAYGNIYYREGMTVTADSCQFGFAALHAACLVPENVRVLEVGAGYGGFAYALSKQVDISLYTFVDGEPSLSIQRYFRAEAMPNIEADFRHINQTFLPADSHDLAVAMHCLGEMSLSDARHYLELFAHAVKPGGHLYLISWKHENLRGERREQCSKLSDYEPVLRDDWRFVFRRLWPEIFDANPAQEWLLERK